MANYATSNALGGTLITLSGTYVTIINAYSSSTTALRRGKIYDLLVGSLGSPADAYFEWDVSRFSVTISISATAVTPSPLDTADAAMLGVSYANSTADSTYLTGASVFNVGVNQRASYRWVAAPGSELVYPEVNLNGLALRVKTGGSSINGSGQLYIQEQ